MGKFERLKEVKNCIIYYIEISNIIYKSYTYVFPDFHSLVIVSTTHLLFLPLVVTMLRRWGASVIAELASGGPRNEKSSSDYLPSLA